MATAPNERPKVPLRAWMFTINNPTEEDEAQVKALVPKAVRMVVGREEAPTTGTPHLQGYVRFVKSIRFEGLKSLLPRANLYPRKGTESQASTYCKKDGDLMVDHGIDCDRGRGQKRPRDEEAAEVMEEIEKGETYGAIRNRHKLFVFWNRQRVIDFLYDEGNLRSNPQYDPNDVACVASYKRGRPW